MQTPSQRTQIYLPKDLRDEIERQRRVSGESLAEYLRVAARERVAKEKKRKVDLKKLAAEVIGSIKPGEGGWGKVKNVNAYIRKTRQEEDAHRFGKLK